MRGEEVRGERGGEKRVGGEEEGRRRRRSRRRSTKRRGDEGTRGADLICRRSEPLGMHESIVRVVRAPVVPRRELQVAPAGRGWRETGAVAVRRERGGRDVGKSGRRFISPEVDLVARVGEKALCQHSLHQPPSRALWGGEGGVG